jgi:multiple RNA-binding domain-containing protein 1
MLSPRDVGGERLTAAQIADKELPKSRRQQREERAESRYNDYLPPPKDSSLKRKRDETEQDPKLKEFLDVMQPPSKMKGWANDDTPIDASAPFAAEPAEVVVASEAESDDEYQVLEKKSKTAVPTPAIASKSVPATTPKVAEQTEEPKEQTVGAVPDTEGPAPEQGLVSDADWLRSRTDRVLDLVEDDEAPPRDVPIVDAEESSKVEDDAQDAVEQPCPNTHEPDTEATSISAEEDKIRETGRLFLRNLHFDVTEDDLRTHFSKYGAIDEVRFFFAFS